MASARSSSPLVPALLVAASIGALAVVQPILATNTAAVTEANDAYGLPPPEQLPVVSLGYRSAVADLLWASVLVRQGLRLGEHRRFDFAARYFDSIFALEPTYREPYLMVDAVLTWGAKRATVEDVYDTRRLLEQGLRERPYDAQLYLQAGSFLAYIAPGYLDVDTQKDFRLEGAEMLTRAAELGTGNTTVQWHAMSAVGVLSRNGQRDAAVSFLERTYAITEDAELRENILDQLRALHADEVADRVKASATRFESTWRGELPFVSRTMILLLGPDADPYVCADVSKRDAPECSRDWRTWLERTSPK